jgi:Uma2 family endonuclease
VSSLIIKLPIRPDQTEFNLRRWEEICADPYYARIEGRVETDHHGNAIMTPPPQNPHSNRQSEIYFLLRSLLPAGRSQVGVPV